MGGSFHDIIVFVDARDVFWHDEDEQIIESLSFSFSSSSSSVHHHHAKKKPQNINKIVPNNIIIFAPNHAKK